MSTAAATTRLTAWPTERKIGSPPGSRNHSDSRGVAHETTN
jgi:hypothetical protein